MGNHFRKPGDGQAAPKVEDPRLSVVSADYIVAPEDTGYEPVTDPFAYTPAPDVTAPVAPLDMADAADDITMSSLDADMDPQVTQPGLLNIPSPTDPVAPSSTGAFMTSAGAVDPHPRMFPSKSRLPRLTPPCRIQTLPLSLLRRWIRARRWPAMRVSSPLS